MDAVGPGRSADWKIEPTKHAKKFIETAPALAEVLGRSQVEEISRQFSATRQAIANGKPAVLTEFFTAVGDVLLEEHTQWLEESKRKNAAIDKLAEVLKNQSSESPTKVGKTSARKKTNRS